MDKDNEMVPVAIYVFWILSAIYSAFDCQGIGSFIFAVLKVGCMAAAVIYVFKLAIQQAKGHEKDGNSDR